MHVTQYGNAIVITLIIADGSPSLCAVTPRLVGLYIVVLEPGPY